ncbi:MAG: glutathione S-transferase family protein [Pseudomonadales bacterium]|nr:glutathione S-transferase family protein [Pseudomonadales bacterium]
MSNESLILYHHGSSACAAKVRFALAEKALDWESVYIDILAGEQFRADYLAVNPKGVVPTLKHRDRIIVESTLICEYLEDCFPSNALYPSDPYEKLLVRYWTKAVDEELHPACSALTYVVSHRHTILRNGVGNFEDFLKTDGAGGLAARTLKWQWLQEGLSAPGAAGKIRLYLSYLDRMEEALMHSDWLVGSHFSMADVALAPYVNRLMALAMEGAWQHGRRPRVEAWFQRIQHRSGFQSAIRDWVPQALQAEMLENGKRSWPEVRTLLD